MGCTNIERLDGQELFVECAYRVKSDDYDFGPLLLKVAEKAFDPSSPPKFPCTLDGPGQLALCGAPVLLGMGGHLCEDLYDGLLKYIAADYGFATVSAIAQAERNAERVRLWHNPLAKRPLPKRIGFAIEACFEPRRQS